jgi:hypothetical protein
MLYSLYPRAEQIIQKLPALQKAARAGLFYLAVPTAAQVGSRFFIFALILHLTSHLIQP